MTRSLLRYWPRDQGREMSADNSGFLNSALLDTLDGEGPEGNEAVKGNVVLEGVKRYRQVRFSPSF